MADKVVHGYWGARGNGQISRLLLAYTGAVWEDVKYTSPDQWFGKDKQELGLAFPNLPYLIDGDLKLTESSALHRYIPKRFWARTSRTKQLLITLLACLAISNPLLHLSSGIRSGKPSCLLLLEKLNQNSKHSKHSMERRNSLWDT